MVSLGKAAAWRCVEEEYGKLGLSHVGTQMPVFLEGQVALQVCASEDRASLS